MHRQARIGLLGRDRLPGVNADPHPDLRAARPPVRRQRPLDVQRAQHSLLRARERGEERVALGVDLMAAMVSEGGADQAPVLRQHLRVPLA